MSFGIGRASFCCREGWEIFGSEKGNCWKLEKKEEVENILLSLTRGDPEHGKWGLHLQQLRSHQLPKYAQKKKKKKKKEWVKPGYIILFTWSNET